MGRTASAGLRFQPSAIHPSTMLLSMTSCTRKRSRMPSQYYPLSSLRWRLFVDGGSGRGPGVTRRLPHPGAALSHTECPPIDDTGCTDQAVSVARDPAFCTVVHFTNGSSFATFIVLESSNMPLRVQPGQAPNDVVLGAVGNQLQCLHQLWCTRGHVITSIHITMDSWRTDANKPSLLKVSLPRLTSSATAVAASGALRSCPPRAVCWLVQQIEASLRSGTSRARRRAAIMALPRSNTLLMPRRLVAGHRRSGDC